jgi:hypothetical protein
MLANIDCRISSFFGKKPEKKVAPKIDWKTNCVLPHNQNSGHVQNLKTVTVADHCYTVADLVGLRCQVQEVVGKKYDTQWITNWARIGRFVPISRYSDGVCLAVMTKRRNVRKIGESNTGPKIILTRTHSAQAIFILQRVKYFLILKCTKPTRVLLIFL